MQDPNNKSQGVANEVVVIRIMAQKGAIRVIRSTSMSLVTAVGQRR
jgi:hypothetical protein